jgi:hypothetical protein
MRAGPTITLMPHITIDIDPGVLRDLKKRQRREGKTLGGLISELLTEAMSKTGQEVEKPFTWTTQPMVARIDLADKEAVRRALDEL